MIISEGKHEKPWVDDLRAITKAPEDEWRERLTAVIGRNAEPAQVQEMRAFLNDHLSHATERYRERMTSMIALLSAKLSELGLNGTVVAEVVGRIVELQDEVSRLSEALRSSKDALAGMLGTGARQTVGAYSVHIGYPRASIRVLDKAKVPEILRTFQPDRQLILRHFKSTGEVPAGVDITESRPAVVVKPVKTE